MAEPFLGEIRMFAGNFAPRGWALCDGQLLAVSQYDALFSLLGTIYGGDGRTTFGLPELRGRIPVHPNGSALRLGRSGGSETVTLTAQQLPQHSHALPAASEPADRRRPRSSLLARTEEPAYTEPNGEMVAMRADAVFAVGGSQGHSNLQPFLCVNFIIALAGIYPSRN